MKNKVTPTNKPKRKWTAKNTWQLFSDIVVAGLIIWVIVLCILSTTHPDVFSDHTIAVVTLLLVMFASLRFYLDNIIKRIQGKHKQKKTIMQQMTNDLETLKATLAHAKEANNTKLYEQTLLEIKITEKYMYEFDSLTAIRHEH